ncbi:MAG TPA: Gmad2 immunoglobulin-like domain-containing protein [Gaiellaceae bacterium]|nr:Gmad2 immunoglobulin-like domain-containing protein [Gaiellaceae bacterium]
MRRLVPLALVVALAGGCGSAKTVTVTRTETVTRTVTAPPQKANVRVYFLRDGKVAPVGRNLDSTARDALVAALDEGPTAEERAAGFAAPEGEGRTAAVVYTLSQFSPREPVEVDGKRYTRSDFEDLTPTILVESPLPFQAVSAPLRVTGTANTFEATFAYELLDPAGKVLSHDFVTATSGTGTRGTFEFTVPFEAPDWIGKLVVFENSAADGSRIHQVEIPLTLAR